MFTVAVIKRIFVLLYYAMIFKLFEKKYNNKNRILFKVKI